MFEERRDAVLAELAKYTGQQKGSAFLNHTSNYIPTIRMFHHLRTGIYKPAWSDYALSIIIKLSSPYERKDKVVDFEDGRWRIIYSPRVGGLEQSDNRALVKCMNDGVAIGVFKQLTDTTDRKHGSSYLVMGLGLVKSYDSNDAVFIVEGADDSAVENVTEIISDVETRQEVQLYTQLTNEFQPFIKEERASYIVNAIHRDSAFRNLVLREYSYACAICGMRFQFGDLSEVTAAHIVPKHLSGTDDPRNGIALCHNHHWAFDAGLFSITDDYKITLSPVLGQADTSNFDLLNMEGHQILLPSNEATYPHKDALAWHRVNVWKH